MTFSISYYIFYDLINNTDSIIILGRLKMVCNVFKKNSEIKMNIFFKREMIFINEMKKNLNKKIIYNFYNNFIKLPKIISRNIFRLNILKSIYMMVWKNYLNFEQKILLNHEENEWCCNILEKYNFNDYKFYAK